MSEINLEALIMLRDHIENNVKQSDFNMHNFRMDRDGRTKDFISSSQCGSVGCILGHMPFINNPAFCTIYQDWKIPNIRNHDFGDRLPTLDFLAYSERVLKIASNEAVWDYLFSGDWAVIDNTVEGAVFRLNNVISDIQSGMGDQELDEKYILKTMRLDEESEKYCDSDGTAILDISSWYDREPPKI